MKSPEKSPVGQQKTKSFAHDIISDEPISNDYSSADPAKG